MTGEHIVGGKIASSRMVPLWLVIVLLVSTLSACLLSFRIEVLVGDYLLTSMRENKVSETDIVVVAIDEDTLAGLPYRSPIDWSFLADLVEKLDQAKPKLIAVDLLFDQVTESEKDSRLFSSFRSISAPLVVGKGGLHDKLTDAQLAYQHEALAGLDTGLVTLARHDYDGTVRELYPGRKTKTGFEQSFAFAIAAQLELSIEDISGRIAFQNDGTGGAYSFPVYPAHTAHLLPVDWFENKVVLVGVNLPHADKSPTPFVTTKGAEEGNLPGVLIHAHIVQQLMSADVLRVVPPILTVITVAIISALALLIMLTPMSLPFRLFTVTIALSSYLVAVFFVYRGVGVQLPVASTILSVIFVSAALSFYQWLKDRAQRNFLETAFSRYVSPSVVSRISSGQQKLELGGESRLVTYMFTDLEGFTTLVETEDPVLVTKTLNTYLDRICDLFLDHGATIDKIIGDAVVGFFGAPELQENQAEMAVNLALAVDEFSESFRRVAAEQGLRLGMTRIGINKGKAVIGNFGGDRFFDYTGQGDTVNTAARLE